MFSKLPLIMIDFFNNTYSHCPNCKASLNEEEQRESECYTCGWSENSGVPNLDTCHADFEPSCDDEQNS
jgi:anaerobic ribonucleoside-triphosphate reductase